MNLVIVESPAKAKTIEKYLGKDFKVISSVGHIFNLPKKELGIDLEKNFEQKLIPIKGKEDVIKKIKDLSAKADKIYLAADNDREGEAIAFHLKKVIGKRKDVYRVIFNSITKETVNKAIQNPLELNTNMYNSQKARRSLDRLMGYKISPILWNKIGAGLSAGRVQSVALRIIVDREEEIRKFVPDKSFKLSVFLNKDSESNANEFEAVYYGENTKTKNTLKEMHQVEKILKDINSNKLILNNIEKKEKLTKTPEPFTTSKLQQEASKKLNLSSKETMQIAQKLYEGKNLKNHGATGLITYMRTDSVRIEPNKVEELRGFIKDNIGEEYLPEKAIEHDKSSSGKVQNAHEAIRPANLLITPDSIKDELTLDEYKLYTLIWKRFVASQMKNMIQEETIYWTNHENHFFKTSGIVLVFDGFRKIYNYSTKNGDSELGLPAINEKDELNQTKKPVYKESFTSPPPRYTEATLVKELDKRGIGRPSTYASIIDNIIGKKYVEYFQKNMRPTELGEVLCLMLIKNFPKQLDVKFTANVEKQLDLIESGEEKMKEVLSNFWNDLLEKIKEAYSSKGLKPESLPLGIKCQKCESGEIELNWVNGKEFGYCNRCTFKAPIEIKDFDQIEFVPIKEGEQKECPKCGGFLAKKKGKWGEFWACTNFPECNHTMPMTTGVKCPTCKKGEYVKKKTKNGNIMYGCSEFPNCKEVLWNKPLKRRCMHCSHTVLEEYSNGKIHCPKCKKYQ